MHEIDKVLTNLRKQLSYETQNRFCSNNYNANCCILDECDTLTSIDYSQTHSELARERVKACVEERRRNENIMAGRNVTKAASKVDEMIKEAEATKLFMHRPQGRVNPEDLCNHDEINDIYCQIALM